MPELTNLVVLQGVIKEFLNNVQAYGTDPQALETLKRTFKSNNITIQDWNRLVLLVVQQSEISKCLGKDPDNLNTLSTVLNQIFSCLVEISEDTDTKAVMYAEGNIIKYPTLSAAQSDSNIVDRQVIAVGDNDAIKFYIKTGNTLELVPAYATCPWGELSGSPEDSTELNNYINDKHLETFDNKRQSLDDIDDDSLESTYLSAQGVKDIKDTLDERISNLESRGRFLALWDAETGLPTSEPEALSYDYHTGDYFIVSHIGEVNYRPEGTVYNHTASTTVETLELNVDDVYYFDGTTWNLQANDRKDVTFASISGSPEDNAALKTALDSKSSVQFDDENHTITIDGVEHAVGGGGIPSVLPEDAGKFLKAGNDGTIAVSNIVEGTHSTESPETSLAIGAASKASASSVAIGMAAKTEASYGTAVGQNASTASNCAYSTAIGYNAQCRSTGYYGTAFGSSATVTKDGGLAIGNDAQCLGKNAVALGKSAAIAVPNWISFDGTSDSYVRTLSLKNTDNLVFRKENVSTSKTAAVNYANAVTLTQLLEPLTSGNFNIPVTFNKDINIPGTSYIGIIRNADNRIKFIYGGAERLYVGNTEVKAINANFVVSNGYGISNEQGTRKITYDAGNGFWAFSGPATPDTANSQSLGASYRRWNYVYANYISNGTTTIAIGDIATKQELEAITGVIHKYQHNVYIDTTLDRIWFSYISTSPDAVNPSTLAADMFALYPNIKIMCTFDQDGSQSIRGSYIQTDGSTIYVEGSSVILDEVVDHVVQIY